MIPPRMYFYAAALAAILALVFAYGHHQKQQGRAEVQAQWDKATVTQQAALIQANEANAETSRLMRRAAQRSREHDARTAQALAAANDVARTELSRLRDTIATLNRSGEAARAADARPHIDEPATVARELLGECSGKYQDLAAEAGRLAGQLIGLQGFVMALEVSRSP